LSEPSRRYDQARLVDPHQAAIAGRARDLAMVNLAIDEQARQMSAWTRPPRNLKRRSGTRKTIFLVEPEGMGLTREIRAPP
jgi:hypothetical protein